MKLHLREFPILLVTLLLLAVPAQAEEGILSQSVEIRVKGDKKILVTETIQFNAESEKIKYGIVRAFPNKTGSSYTTQFGTLDGAPIEVHSKTESRPPNVLIYLGVDGKQLAPGIHTVSAQHEISGLIEPFEQGDRLLWNVTGAQLSIPIQNTEVQIIFPPDIPSKAIRVRAYTKLGPKEEELAVTQQGQTFSLRTKRALEPSEALFVEAIW
ncbi:MAG: DUF2207 domain-containing protein [Deltaproteobacteria bacterium]|nr:DUF2207 domain-containing protein [Deltaproteobacteria bacterium]